MILADAGDEIAAVGNDVDIENTTAIMPHLAHSYEELQELYPSIPAPADEQLDDLRDDHRDNVLQEGLKVAEQIKNEMSMQGRRRRPTDEQQQVQGPSQGGA